ncbi:hypothetical protein Tco_0996022, partial [Tanacetum coccineum]
VAMSEYLRFPFLSGASISKGPLLASQDRIEQHTTHPLSSDQPIPEKTDHQKEVEVEDPKIVSIRERKAKAAAKKKEREDETWEQRSPRDSAGHSVHNYSGQHDDERTDTLRLGTSGGQSGRVLVDTTTEVVQSSPGNIDEGESSWGRAFYMPDWSIHRRCRLDTPEWCRELMVHLAPLAAQEESNALNNATALERAWFSLSRGALAQTEILERFEQIQASFDELAETHAGCEDTVRQLLDAREISQLNSRLYLDVSERFRKFKNDHAGCPDRIRFLEDRNNELSQVNNEQSLQIKELEDLLAKKDYALVYAERINSERAQEKEKLVTQLGKTEMEKFDSIRKLLPTQILYNIV